MPTILITDECHRLLQANANAPFKKPGRRLRGGWEIEIEQDTLDHLCNLQFPEESLSDTIMRGVVAMKGSFQ
jgi:hypothetical protein